MPEHIVIAKIILCLIGVGVSGYDEGVGAFYHERPGLMREVCRRRVAEGWNPELNCQEKCLAAGIHASEIGSYVLADLPGHSLVL